MILFYSRIAGYPSQHPQPIGYCTCNLLAFIFSLASYRTFNLTLVPGLSSSGPDNLDNLKKLAEQFQKQAPGADASAGHAHAHEDEDEEVPQLVPGETFEAAAEEKPASS